MSHVIQVGMRMLTCYGWQPANSEVPPNAIATTDADDSDSPAHYYLETEFPLLFSDADDAQRTIDRFHIADAKPIRWNR